MQIYKRVSKAIGGAVSALIPAIAFASGDGFTAKEIGAIVGAGVTGFLITYFAPKNAEQ